MDRLGNPVFNLIKIMIINIINQLSSVGKTQKISNYPPKSSTCNEKESNAQESHSNFINEEEETLKCLTNPEKNSPRFDNKDNNKEEEREIFGNNCSTKNTTNTITITSNIIEKYLIIKNIISTVKLNCTLNLKEIASKANNANNVNKVQYKQKKLIMSIKEPKAEAIILSDGKMICSGPKNEKQSKNVCRKFAEIIKNLGYNVTLTNFNIQNMKGYVKFENKLLLNALSLHFMKKMNSTVFYEPEFCKGLIYHYERNPNIVFLIFESGIFIVGAKNRNQIYEALSRVYPLLCKYKRNNIIKII